MCGHLSSTVYAQPSSQKTHTGLEPTLPVSCPCFRVVERPYLHVGRLYVALCVALFVYVALCVALFVAGVRHRFAHVLIVSLGRYFNKRRLSKLSLGTGRNKLLHHLLGLRSLTHPLGSLQENLAYFI